MNSENRKPAPPRHHYHADMLSVEEALDRILSHCHRLEAEDAPLLEALGQVLADEIVAEFDIPPLPNSAMDGYAVRVGDVARATVDSPVQLPVSGVVAAGSLPAGPLLPGMVFRIMTGAPVPEGTEAVVPFEDTDELERERDSLDRIGVRVPAIHGANVRAAGEDVRAGQVVLKRGAVMRPGEIGVAASLGRATVRVIRRPIVAIVSTGDELIEPGQPQQPGKIFNSNAYGVAAAVKRYGGVPKVIGIAGDTLDSLNASLREAVNSDMVVTSAGVSKGDYDVVKDALSQNGEIALWSVRMRPAKPLAFGTLDGPGGRKVPHLGLPGNPVSAMVAFEQFGRPAIHVMMGRPPLPKPRVRAVLDDRITNYDGRRVYARVVVYRGDNGEIRAKTTGTQSSGALSSMALANGFAICPDDIATMDAGEMVEVEMIDWPEDVFSYVSQ